MLLAFCEPFVFVNCVFGVSFIVVIVSVLSILNMTVAKIKPAKRIPPPLQVPMPQRFPKVIINTILANQILTFLNNIIWLLHVWNRYKSIFLVGNGIRYEAVWFDVICLGVVEGGLVIMCRRVGGFVWMTGVGHCFVWGGISVYLIRRVA